MTLVHVIPTGEPLEHHRFKDCPCGPRSMQIPREDNTVDIVQLHRVLEDDEATN